MLYIDKNGTRLSNKYVTRGFKLSFGIMNFLIASYLIHISNLFLVVVSMEDK